MAIYQFSAFLPETRKFAIFSLWQSLFYIETKKRTDWLTNLKLFPFRKTFSFLQRFISMFFLPLSLFYSRSYTFWQYFEISWICKNLAYLLHSTLFFEGLCWHLNFPRKSKSFFIFWLHFWKKKHLFIVAQRYRQSCFRNLSQFYPHTLPLQVSSDGFLKNISSFCCSSFLNFFSFISFFISSFELTHFDPVKNNKCFWLGTLAICQPGGYLTFPQAMILSVLKDKKINTARKNSWLFSYLLFYIFAAFWHWWKI